MRGLGRLPCTGRSPLSVVGLLFATSFTACAALAQSAVGPNPNDPVVVSDDMLMIVVGTRFVGASEEDKSAKAQFTDARIPLSAFNETDHCIDQNALELAQEYFDTLGRVVSKAGHYYFVPDAEISEAVELCQKTHARPPQAWVAGKTRIIAFGKAVPEAEAAALEQLIR